MATSMAATVAVSTVLPTRRNSSSSSRMALKTGIKAALMTPLTSRSYRLVWIFSAPK